MCSKYRVREETSAHILCECEALASLRHAYLDSFLLELEDIWKFRLGGPSGTLVRLGCSHDSIWGTKGPLNQGLGASGLRGPEPKCKSLNQFMPHSYRSLMYAFLFFVSGMKERVPCNCSVALLERNCLKPFFFSVCAVMFKEASQPFI